MSASGGWTAGLGYHSLPAAKAAERLSSSPQNRLVARDPRRSGDRCRASPRGLDDKRPHCTSPKSCHIVPCRIVSCRSRKIARDLLTLSTLGWLPGSLLDDPPFLVEMASAKVTKLSLFDSHACTASVVDLLRGELTMSISTCGVTRCPMTHTVLQIVTECLYGWSHVRYMR